MSRAAANTARYEDRMKANGFVRKHVWVPSDKADEVEVLAEKLRRAATWDAKAIRHERDCILSVLRKNELLLKVQGFDHISLFGSFARGDATPDSDIDLVVKINASERPKGLFGNAKFKMILQTLLQTHCGLNQGVDMVEWQNLKPEIHARVNQDRIDIF